MKISHQDARLTVHQGHTYINGIHWLRHCPLCVALIAKADAIAAKEMSHESKD